MQKWCGLFRGELLKLWNGRECVAIGDQIPNVLLLPEADAPLLRQQVTGTTLTASRAFRGVAAQLFTNSRS